MKSIVKQQLLLSSFDDLSGVASENDLFQTKTKTETGILQTRFLADCLQ